MVRLRSSTLIVLVLAIVAVTSGFQGWAPNAYAVNWCKIQIAGVDYPSTASLGQPIEVATHLMLTCVPVNQNVLARVDIVSLDTNKTIATNTQGLGAVEVPNAPFVKVLNVTITSSIKAPSSAANWKLQVVAWVFTGPDLNGVTRRAIQIQVGSFIQTATTSTIAQTTRTSTNASTSAPGGFGIVGAIGVLVAVGLVASVMVLMRRRKPQMAVPKQETVKEVVRKETKTEAPQQVRLAAPGEENISTGYPELDTVLAGGFPVGYAILMVSPPCDERDLLFIKIIESSLAKQSSIFFLSRDIGRTQDFANRYPTNFYVFSPQADRITAAANVFKIEGVQNLSDVNISFNKAVETLPKTVSKKLIIIDLLSDILLANKALTTRKWLDDFISKRKADGFTILGVLNPMISSKQDSQTLADLFDGIIEIYERELRERARRFLIVKKMYGRKYADTELMLDKDKLF